MYCFFRKYVAIPVQLEISFLQYIITMPTRILEWKPMGRRIRGRTRKRWIEDVQEDIQSLGIRGWRKLSKERTEWKKIAEKAKTHSGFCGFYV